MDSKPLLYGLIGFFMGGLVVSIAATTFDKPASQHAEDMSMSQMTEDLRDKHGDAFDRSFINAMIVHHQGAIDMARLAETNAKHEEIKQLSRDIISAQESEISEMKRWQSEWGYATQSEGRSQHNTH